MADLLIQELGSGGDLVFDGKDLVPVYGYENQPYLAQFGDDGTWWGNSLLLANGQDNEFISQTESVLNKYALNSAGRLKAEAAINADLQYLVNNIMGTTISVTTKIITDNRLEVRIDINGRLFNYQWHPDKRLMEHIV